MMPPNICPKCGSHRTEIVGRSKDAETVTVRCNACGAISTILIEPQAHGSGVATELEVLQPAGAPAEADAPVRIAR